MKFFHFSQNNSGGRFTIDAKQGIGVHVIIEAKNIGAANNRAQQIGLYFNGCDDGMDCSCCGDRWYPCCDKGSSYPQIYGKNVSSGINLVNYSFGNSFIHYADGKIVEVIDHNPEVENEL